MGRADPTICIAGCSKREKIRGVGMERGWEEGSAAKERSAG
jgi:hypothetical protein